MKPELISSKLCPFVQRSVITLLEKQVDFDITYIDVHDKPDWFKKISPLGKVPVLRVGGVVVFESVVISEYLDETNPPSMHPADPLQRALNRSWIEYAAGLIGSVIKLYNAEDEADYTRAYKSCEDQFTVINAQLKHAPYFNGDAFALIDAAYAPPFMRLSLMNERHALGLDEIAPAAWAWGQRLLERDSVVRSVVPDFAELFYTFIDEGGGYAARLFG